MFMFSCRFETKMRQNAPNPISISLFSDTRHCGLCPQTPREGDGREGKGKGQGEGEGRERGRRREGEVYIIAVGGYTPPRYGNVSVCLSGCRSQPIYCIKTTKPILKLFRPSAYGSPETFGTPCADTKF